MPDPGPPASAPLASVVVPHYNDLVRLDACLEALGRQTVPRDSFEIVVADNASPQGEAEVRRIVGDRARVVIAPQKGAGPARNVGAAAARGSVLAFTDCDCLPEPEWLAAGLRALDRFDIVGGRMTVLAQDPAAPTPEECFELAFAFRNDLYVNRKGFSVSANLFCRRDLFETVGGFDVGVSEDVDWCLRARDAGFRLGYAADSGVGHPARRDWPELVRKTMRIDAEMHALALRGRHGRLRWLARTLALPPSALVHTPKALTSPHLSRFRDRLAAVRVLWRLRLWRFADQMRLMRGQAV